MPFELRRHFVRAFNKFPEFSFIWRYDEMEDDDVLFENSTNIQRVKWLPQIDLLSKPLKTLNSRGVKISWQLKWYWMKKILCYSSSLKVFLMLKLALKTFGYLLKFRRWESCWLRDSRRTQFHPRGLVRWNSDDCNSNFRRPTLQCSFRYYYFSSKYPYFDYIQQTPF